VKVQGKLNIVKIGQCLSKLQLAKVGVFFETQCILMIGVKGFFYQTVC